MSVSIISTTTQNLIKEMKEAEEKEIELKAYGKLVNELSKDLNDNVDIYGKKYFKANEHYMNVHISESEDKKLSKELQHEIKVYEKMRSKYYFKMVEYQCKVNMLNNMYKAYLNVNIKKSE